MRGFVRHPVIVTRVVVSRVRTDPVRVAQAAAETLPPRIRPVVGRVAWPAARRLKYASRNLSRKLGMRMVRKPWREARMHFYQGRMSEAIAALEPYTKFPFIKRLQANYAGELAAISPTRSPRSPR